MTLSTLRKADREDSNIMSAVTSSADLLDALAAGGRSAQEVAAAGLRDVDEVVASMTGAIATVGQRLSAQLHEACELQFGDYQPSGNDTDPTADGVQQLRRPAGLESVRLALDTVRAQLDSGSPLFRHALRLASGAAAAPYWPAFSIYRTAIGSR